MTLIRRLNAKLRTRPRPPSHRSRSSCSSTISHPGDTLGAIGWATAATSGGLGHRKERVAEARPFELEEEERHACVEESAHRVVRRTVEELVARRPEHHLQPT